MTKSIGILYICTGYMYYFGRTSMSHLKKNFLPSYEKRYYVFTDAEEIFAENNINVKKIAIEPMPWPLITLLDFQHF